MRAAAAAATSHLHSFTLNLCPCFARGPCYPALVIVAAPVDALSNRLDTAGPIGFAFSPKRLQLDDTLILQHSRGTLGRPVALCSHYVHGNHFCYFSSDVELKRKNGNYSAKAQVTMDLQLRFHASEEVDLLSFEDPLCYLPHYRPKLAQL